MWKVFTKSKMLVLAVMTAITLMFTPVGSAVAGEFCYAYVTCPDNIVRICASNTPPPGGWSACYTLSASVYCHTYDANGQLIAFSKAICPCDISCYF